MTSPRPAPLCHVPRPTSNRVGQLAVMLAACLVAVFACQGRDLAGAPGADEPNAVAPGDGNGLGPRSPNDGVAPTPGESNEVALPGAGNGVVAQPNVAVAPNATVAANPNLRFVGRFDTSNANGPIMSWPNSKVIAGFSGTSVTLNVAAIDQQNYYGIGNVDNYLDVRIDGGPPSIVRVAQGVSSYALAKDLAAGNHTLELTKRTEGQIGSLQYLGLTLDAGAKPVPGPTPRTRRLEFIGDSGTVGYGADGNWAATRCSFTPATENAPAAYSAVTGDLLGADVMVTANSGKGIYQNRDVVNDAVNTLPVLWTMTSGDTYAQPSAPAAARWQPSRFLPDAVVLIVGGNDFAASTPSASAYNKVALQFVQKLRAAYPQAWIFVAISPMLDAPSPGESTPSTSEVATQYAQALVASAADPKVAYLPLALDDGSRGVGCDYHMNAATHRLTAQAIAKFIATKLGWD